MAAMIEKLCVENKIPEAWDGLELPQVGAGFCIGQYIYNVWNHIGQYIPCVGLYADGGTGGTDGIMCVF